MIKFKQTSSVRASFFQALGLSSYIFLVGSFIFRIEHWFKQTPEWIAPIMFLTLFSLSALICGTISLSYPIWLAWEKKNVADAVQVVVYTALWLLLIFVTFIGIFAF